MKIKLSSIIVSVLFVLFFSSCEKNKTNFSVEYSTKKEGLIAVVKTTNTTAHTYQLCKYADVVKMGFNDPVKDMRNVVKTLNRMSEHEIMHGNYTFNFSFSLLAKNTDYIVYNWCYNGNEIDAVTCYQFIITEE